MEAVKNKQKNAAQHSADVGLQKIIVPIDFSEYSEYALEAAANIARKADGELMVLHMLEISEAILTHSDSEQQAKAMFLLEIAKKRFENFLDKPYLKDLKVTPVVKHFKVFSEINDVAKKHDVDLIVMGSHGASGMKEFLIGSNTERVVRNADIPVLVVKHSPILMDFDNVVYACDFSKDAVDVYLRVRSLFKKLGSKLHLLYVNTPNEGFRSTHEIDQRIAEFFKVVNGRVPNKEKISYYSDYSVEKGITNFANLHGADLIAVATHGRTGLAHFFGGSITEDLANHSALPVMTFKL